uniref:Uncharacterized protein n=1 Tax=Solanum lycopersicum TaxID=4081 RepID=A0A3Q7JEV1_SOLLC
MGDFKCRSKVVLVETITVSITLKVVAKRCILVTTLIAAETFTCCGKRCY